MGKKCKKGGRSAGIQLRKTVNRAIYNSGLEKAVKDELFKITKVIDPEAAANQLLKSHGNGISAADKAEVIEALVFLKDQASKQDASSAGKQSGDKAGQYQ